MKKILLILCMMVSAVSASAQFERGKTYIGASLSGLNLSYNENTKLSFELGARAGYFFFNNILFYANAQFNVNQAGDGNHYALGLGARYYFVSNGIFIGLNGNYKVKHGVYHDVMPEIEAGWAYFLNRIVTLEPSVYFSPSFMRASRNTFGLRVGIGINLETNKKKELDPNM